MAQDIVDLVVVVDDASQDETTAIARTLPTPSVHTHPINRGYGANQKTCYQAALDAGADIVIMVHPDYQYTPKLIPAMASLIGNGLYSCVFGSRILGGLALQGGMPLWKYLANRFLTCAENLLLGAKLSEYHTGYRAFSRKLLERLPLEAGLRRFRLRQPDARPDRLAGRNDRRGQLPDPLRTRILLDQFQAQRGLRAGLPAHRPGLPPGEAGPGPLEAVPAGPEGGQSACGTGVEVAR